MSSNRLPSWRIVPCILIEALSHVSIRLLQTVAFFIVKLKPTAYIMVTIKSNTQQKQLCQKIAVNYSVAK